MATSSSATTTLISRRDLSFLLYEWLDLVGLFARPLYAGHSRDVVDDILDVAERIAAERFAPHLRQADENEPRMDSEGKVVLVDGLQPALRAFFDAGLAAAGFPAEVGGMQLPHLVVSAALALVQAANLPSSAYAQLTMAAANLLVAHGSKEQIERYVGPMLEGRFFGTMCLSETQAGSSLSDITTRAEPQADGTYRLFGSKMWISGGDHELSENIVHLVLAKIPGGPPGVKGISLFIVPRYLVGSDQSIGERNDVTLVGLNHKMGYRATVNTVLSFGEGEHRPQGSAGAIGYLIGGQHRGLSYMFHMMNQARVEIGLGSTAIGYTGYLKSLRYARERPQGRPPLGKDPRARQVLIIEHPDVRRMLLAQKSYVEGALGLLLYCAKLLDDEQSLPEQRADVHLLLELLTPIAKSWPSQWCLQANSLAMQVLGGYGYAREYEVEQHYRDNRLNPIHEGTHGIQALDLLGRKVTMDDGRALRLLAELIAQTVDRARAVGGEAASHADALAAVFHRLEQVTAHVTEHEHIREGLANASVYLEAAGHIVVAWIWLEQVLAAHGEDGDFYEGKRAAARFFYSHELPRVGPQLDLLGRHDPTTLETDPAWL